MYIIFRKKCFLCKHWSPRKRPRRIRLLFGNVNCIAIDSIDVKVKKLLFLTVYIINGCKLTY
jgi:hypothetical protein